MTTATRPESDATQSGSASLELSVVIPCLNEADTLGICLEKAQQAIRANDITAEIIVADNGSTDASPEIARQGGARLVPVSRKGYGNALMGGIAAARGTFVIMADADDSYDFLDIPKFVLKLREGNDLVQGCRLPSGGGTVLPGAMPFLHRWWGNPMFSMLGRWWFKAPIHDIYCGFRGFRRDFYEGLNQRCTGMEFATEMIIKASLFRARIAEVPIRLHPDGRKSHAPHLKTFRDGWRTLRFFLLYSPRWLFLMPGLFLILLGVLGYALALPGVQIAGATLDAHTLMFASLFLMCGVQAVLFAVIAKVFALTEGLMPPDPRFDSIFKVINLERGILAGAGSLVVGVILLLAAINRWRLTNFGHLDYAHTMRLVIPGATLTALGFQTVLSSFLISMLGTRRR